MTTIGPNSTWDQGIVRAGDRNPYAYLINDINQVAFPEYPSHVRKVLVAFGCIHVATALVCISVLLLPIVRGTEVRKRHFWLVRKQYIASSSTPYHVMNSGLVVVVSQLLSSLVFITYIALDYCSLKSTSFPLRAYLHVCWELCLLPGYFGFHVTAFSSLYTCLCSPRYTTKRPSAFIQPFFLNLLLYIIPVIVFLQTLAWSIVLAFGIAAEAAAYQALISYLEVAAAEWTPNQRVTSSARRATSMFLGQYIKKGKYFLTCWTWSSRCWSIIGLGLALFYAINVVALIRLLRRCLKAAATPQQLASRTRANIEGLRRPGTARKPEPTLCLPKQQFVGDTFGNLTPSKLQSQPSTKDLRDGYVYLVGHCSVMLLNLLIHVICSIMRNTHVDKVIVDKRWRSSSTWIVLVGSCLASIAMLFHSWRIFTERDNTTVQKPTGERADGISNLQDTRRLPISINRTLEINDESDWVGPSSSRAQQREFKDMNYSGTRNITRWPLNPAHLKCSPSDFSTAGVLTDYTSFDVQRVDTHETGSRVACHPEDPANTIRILGSLVSRTQIRPDVYPQRTAQAPGSMGW